jgi:hypothetical protein
MPPKNCLQGYTGSTRCRSVTFNSQREFDDFLAQHVMGWSIWNGDWYSSIPDGHKFQHVRIWTPTSDPAAAMQVLAKCLEKAQCLNYVISIDQDSEGRYHVNGDHPIAKRLLVIDLSLEMAVCRFALQLFDIDPASA